jgi:aspartyl-tRNA(Asn)/glutamyl-tRNA(Gln) amidotransferase subunit C
MATIDRAEVARIATLSRLELDDATLDAMASHLAKIIEHAAKLDRFDGKDVPPLGHGGSLLTPALRQDEIRPSLPVHEALANAPEKGPDGFKVPAILE